MHHPPHQPGPPRRHHPADSSQPPNDLGHPTYAVYARQPPGRGPALAHPPRGGSAQGHPPTRTTRSTALLITVAAIAALLLVGAVVVLAARSGEEPPDAGAAGEPAPAAGSVDPASARGTAERAVESLNAKDFAALTALACAGTDPERALPNPEVFQGIEFEAVLEDVEENGAWATARIRVTAFGRSEVAPPLYLTRNGPGWCIGTRTP